MSELSELLKDANDEFVDFIRDEKITDKDDERIDERINEIADSTTPIYNTAIMAVASCPEIMFRDSGGLADENADLVRHASVRIYAHIREYLTERVEAVIDSFEPCDDCGEFITVDETYDPSSEGLGDGHICDTCMDKRRDHAIDHAPSEPVYASLKTLPHTIPAENPETGETLDHALAWVHPASDESVALVMGSEPNTMNGRSEPVWVRLSNGDLILGVFPRGDTYFAVEEDARYPG